MSQVRCRSCWWWKISIFAGYGRCYRHACKDKPFTMTKVRSFCGDHVNRKKKNRQRGMTLDEWIDNNIKH